MTFHLRVLTVILVLLGSGCAGLGTQRDSIRVTVSDIRVIEATLLEQVYRVTLRVQNRAADAIDIRGGSFDLAINGRDFGSGVTDQSVTVPGYADAKIEVRMVSTVFGMLRMVESMRSREGRALDYEISGSFSTGSGFGGVSFHESGEVALPSGHGALDDDVAYELAHVVEDGPATTKTQPAGLVRMEHTGLVVGAPGVLREKRTFLVDRLVVGVRATGARHCRAVSRKHRHVGPLATEEFLADLLDTGQRRKIGAQQVG